MKKMKLRNQMLLILYPTSLLTIMKTKIFLRIFRETDQCQSQLQDFISTSSCNASSTYIVKDSSIEILNLRM